MNINSIGINSYRQAMEKPQVEKRPAPEKQPETNKTDLINIPENANRVGSKMGVRLEPGSFVDMLSNEEKQAFEMAFEKYGGAGALGGTYANNGEAETSDIVGSHVDVKL